MTTAALGGPSTAAPAPASSGPALGRDDFLKLLVAQLSNQDPMSPQEGHEFAAQLAQFASVEQLAGIGGTLKMHSNQLAVLAEGLEAAAQQRAALGAALGQGLDLGTASALIGRTVEVRTGEVAWDGASAPMLGVDLAGPAAQVTVTVRDAEGNVVRTLALGARGAGAHTASWDGTDAEGNALPPGRYTFEVSAAAADGSAVSVERFARGTASRLAVDPDGVRIWLGDLSVPLSALRGVVG